MQMNFDLVVPIELQSRVSGGGTYMRLGSVLPMLPWEPELSTMPCAPLRMTVELFKLTRPCRVALIPAPALSRT